MDAAASACCLATFPAPSSLLNAASSASLLKLAAAAYLLPFLMVFNPALIMQGSATAIVLVTITVIVSGWLLAYAIDALSQHEPTTKLLGLLLLVGAIVLGASTIWIGAENFLVLVPAALGLGVLFLMNNRLKSTV